MKTVAFNSRGSLFRGLFVLAALGGFYYFRKNGGTVSDLLASGRQGLGQARDFINRAAPAVEREQSLS